MQDQSAKSSFSVPAGVLWSEHLEIPAQPEFVGPARRRIVELVTNAGFSTEDTNDVALAVGEAMSNAVEHSGKIDGAVVKAWCKINRDAVEIVVRDQGMTPWEPPGAPLKLEPETEVSELSHRGRGLYFMQQIMDDFRIRFTGNGTQVEFIKRRKLP